jgi:hypothetical protein
VKHTWAVPAVTLALAACGSGTTMPPAHHASPPPMSLLQACRILRADMVANSGQADKPTLVRIYWRTIHDQATSKLALDAGGAEKDVGTSLWPLDAAFMARDCQSTGVQIPTLTNP